VANWNRFAICEAYALLENHYNVGGWLRERPSNQRRMESIGVQLHRIRYSNLYAPGFDDAEEDVKEIYLIRVLEWKLPTDADLRRFILLFFCHDWLNANYPDFMKGVET